MLPGFAERRKALEEAFFQEREKEQLAALRAAQQKSERKQLLRETSGIADDGVLDKLVELDVTVETLCALRLVPLVRVAWADGSIQDKEREAILRAAEGQSIAAGSPAFALLESWLVHKPGDDLRDTWRAYVVSLGEQMTADQRETLRDLVIERARAIASAAGGFLGVKAISASEEAELAELAKSFD